jgi:hypothetical protein
VIFRWLLRSPCTTRVLVGLLSAASVWLPEDFFRLRISGGWNETALVYFSFSAVFFFLGDGELWRAHRANAVAHNLLPTHRLLSWCRCSLFTFSLICSRGVIFSKQSSADLCSVLKTAAALYLRFFRCADSPLRFGFDEHDHSILWLPSWFCCFLIFFINLFTYKHVLSACYLISIGEAALLIMRRLCPFWVIFKKSGSDLFVIVLFVPSTTHSSHMLLFLFWNFSTYCDIFGEYYHKLVFLLTRQDLNIHGDWSDCIEKCFSRVKILSCVCTDPVPFSRLVLYLNYLHFVFWGHTSFCFIGTLLQR